MKVLVLAKLLFLFLVFIDMNLTPLLDRVVLKPIEADNITKSGIYIPETAKKEKPFIYEVVAV